MYLFAIAAEKLEILNSQQRVDAIHTGAKIGDPHAIADGFNQIIGSRSRKHRSVSSVAANDRVVTIAARQSVVALAAIDDISSEEADNRVVPGSAHPTQNDVLDILPGQHLATQEGKLLDDTGDLCELPAYR